MCAIFFFFLACVLFHKSAFFFFLTRFLQFFPLKHPQNANVHFAAFGKKKKVDGRRRRSSKGRLARGVGQNSCPMIMFMKIITRRGSCWVWPLQRWEGFKVETLLLSREKGKKKCWYVWEILIFSNRMRETDVKRASLGLLIGGYAGFWSAPFTK